MPEVDITIIGAGVVGLAIAARLSEKHRSVVVLEKNAKYGLETSSRNSEVIHAGIYYPHGSLKAQLCVEGRDELYTLCAANDIAHRRLTKIIVATEENERTALETIYANGTRNGVPLELLDAKATRQLEPHIRAVASVYSPLSGVLSTHQLMEYFYHTACANGAVVQFQCEVVGLQKRGEGYAITIREQGNLSTVASEIVINAAGLQADTVAAMVGIDIDQAGYRQVYAKGSYFAVAPAKTRLLSRLVYPVPLKESLGVHALLDWGGRLKFGPDIEYLPDRVLDYSVNEQKRNAFAASIQRIVPAITAEDLSPDMAGIRPKLQRQGEPPRDFVIVHEKERGLEGFVNLIGIESPGLTASPAIARYVETLLF
jgi:L-2-hydroxyglutarate oxidase LhgO